MNVTVPVGWPFAPVGTDALRVSEAPSSEGFALETSVTLLLASTIWLRTGDVLPTLFESPPYTAVRA
jgi:hypothetical protein